METYLCVPEHEQEQILRKCHSEFYYYGSLVDYAIDMSKLGTYALLQMWLVIIFAENLNAGFTYLQQQEQTKFVKVFLYHFQFIN